ncbi:type II secretion system F family protein [Sphingobium sp. CAP-1]|uniref:type II secretion system F family protein n=1 Tax=Sphingobium sp. CAP-1 TaxID=2676077 RepID=UPI0012BB2976|nr:type II secretion system F family protein [Sphingobium sp. CAP-1]QGP80479.1 type II secretion system protein [Sphingobium sp. CAP-1]
MPQFHYRAATPGGAVREGAIDAGTAAQALTQLRNQGLRPIGVTPAVAAKGATAAKLDPAEVAKLFGELAMLLDAGLSLDRALAIAIDNAGSQGMRESLQALHKQVKEGTPLSEALTATRATFPPLAAPMIAAGEASATLPAALAKLAATLERSQKLRNDIISALIYPIILTGIGLSVIILMLLFIVPQFEGLFAGGQDRLPPMTRFVMHASQTFRAYGLPMLGLLVATCFLLRGWMRQPAARAMLDRRLIALPRIGDLIRRIETGRFARVLGTLLNGGMALAPALALAQRTIGNRVMADTTARIVERVREGAGFSQQVAESGLFPRLAISFIRTGEETARLDTMLERLADALDDEIAIKLKRFVTILTPAITVVMGLIVATVIGSIMTAILGFNDLALE